MRFIFCFLLMLATQQILSQFDPPAGQTGSKAISKDSSIFIDWAKNCVLKRGWQQITDTILGKASAGDSSSALGMAGGGFVSLGDGGEAILSFNKPILNGPGADFAVFENSFSDKFLELAFVEVSSDGINYYRFPAICNTDSITQVTGFGETDATKMYNLAGKYRANYGTPFDLEEMKNIPGLNINNITQVKIIDAIGTINPLYGSRDSRGFILNEPFPTPFASSGFDLDAVGVINNPSTGINALHQNSLRAYPNPCNNELVIDGANHTEEIIFIDITGKRYTCTNNNNRSVDTSELPGGIYVLMFRDSLTKIQVIHQ